LCFLSAPENVAHLPMVAATWNSSTCSAVNTKPQQGLLWRLPSCCCSLNTPSFVPQNEAPWETTWECRDTKHWPISGCITMSLPWRAEPIDLLKNNNNNNNNRDQKTKNSARKQASSLVANNYKARDELQGTIDEDDDKTIVWTGVGFGVRLLAADTHSSEGCDKRQIWIHVWRQQALVWTLQQTADQRFFFFFSIKILPEFFATWRPKIIQCDSYKGLLSKRNVKQTRQISRILFWNCHI